MDMDVDVGGFRRAWWVEGVGGMMGRGDGGGRGGGLGREDGWGGKLGRAKGAGL